MFRVFGREGNPRSHSAPHDGAGTSANEWIDMDTAGPYPESLGGLRYVIMFVDSAFRLQRPYGTWDKSTPAILAFVKNFVADMRVPSAFRTDNGSEYTNRTFPGTVMVSESAVRWLCPKFHSRIVLRRVSW